MPTQYHVRYVGHVQGVGFRWTCRDLARRRDVTGWVRNCSDGSVELVAEGEPAECLAFLGDIRASMARNIQDEQVGKRAARGQFHDFDIRH